MSTIEGTVAEFNKDFCTFQEAIGDKRNSNESIRQGFKVLGLRYLGLTGATPDEVERCAMTLNMAASGALMRGWDISGIAGAS